MSVFVRSSILVGDVFSLNVSHVIFKDKHFFKNFNGAIRMHIGSKENDNYVINMR